MTSPQKMFYSFRAEEKATWYRLLLRRHPPRLSQLASHRRVRGDVRVSFRLRILLFSGRVSVLPLLTCSVAPIRVTMIPLRSMSLPLAISSKHLALAIPLPHLPVFGLVGSRATVVWRPPYAVSHFPARLYNRVILGKRYNHITRSIPLDSVIGYPPTDHRLWPGFAPRF
ncbi:hypothetical protein BGW80DRAFT_508157 [Lactifluus volemus]|nr:hypothetical protein BGW80DRAFT_508157 [Lactifluus volemus]